MVTCYLVRGYLMSMDHNGLLVKMGRGRAIEVTHEPMRPSLPSGEVSKREMVRHGAYTRRGRTDRYKNHRRGARR